MSKALQNAHLTAANGRAFEAADLREPTLQNADEWYSIFETQGTKSEYFGAGYGVNDDSRNTEGWSDLDLQNAGGNAIDARIRFYIYSDSSKQNLVARSGTYSTTSLRNSVSAARKDKVLIPGMLSTLAGDDSYLVVKAQPRAASTGDDVSASNSSTDEGIAYSEILSADL